MPVARSAEVHDKAASLLDALGQQYTPTRRTVVDVLRRARDPLTIPEIMKAKPALALSSVYRTLSVLEEAGIVERLATGHEFARYELAEDLGTHHHHLICTGCGRVRDVVLPTRVDRAAARSLEEAAAEAGFVVHGHRLDIVGLCSRCA